MEFLEEFCFWCVEQHEKNVLNYLPETVSFEFDGSTVRMEETDDDGE